ncbi:MAG: ABC transporter permease [Chloroflexi bacterium]|nr:ABC transporter permease [Chloroflexota bacterium]
MRLLSLIRKEFIQIIRDPRTLAMIFVMPVMQLFLLGYAATNDVRNISLVVFDQDKSPQSRELLDAYRAADYFRLDYDVNDEESIRYLIDSNRARAAIIIPPDYHQKIASGRVAQVAFVIDGSDPTVASTALAAANLIAQSKSTAIMTERLAARGQAGAIQLPVETRTQVWYNPDLVSAYFMIPALIGQILFTITIILTAVSVVRERERGTIEQLIVTPIRSWELVVGKITPYVVIVFIDMIEVLIAGVLIFGIPINGSLTLLLILSALFLVTTLGLGLFISTIANTQQEAMLSAMFTMLPSIFLSGFFFPIAAMPLPLQWISYLMPPRYYLIIVRSIILKGSGAENLVEEIVALSIFAVVIMGAAAMRFKKRLD